jgi:hypothetical protein
MKRKTHACCICFSDRFLEPSSFSLSLCFRFPCNGALVLIERVLTQYIWQCLAKRYKMSCFFACFVKSPTNSLFEISKFESSPSFRRFWGETIYVTRDHEQQRDRRCPLSSTIVELQWYHFVDAIRASIAIHRRRRVPRACVEKKRGS